MENALAAGLVPHSTTDLLEERIDVIQEDWRRAHAALHPET